MFSDQMCDGERQVQIEIGRLIESESKNSGAKKADVRQSWRICNDYVVQVKESHLSLIKESHMSLKRRFRCRKECMQHLLLRLNARGLDLDRTQ